MAVKPSISNPQAGSSPGGERIVLLVDDDPDYRMMVRDVLEGSPLHLRIFECEHGGDGLKFLRRENGYANAPRPDVIFLDLEMPCMDGRAVLSEVRADPGLRELPVVVLTGIDDDAEERMALKHGANSYTTKSNDVEAMFHKIASAAEYWTMVHRPLNQRDRSAA